VKSVVHVTIYVIYMIHDIKSISNEAEFSSYVKSRHVSKFSLLIKNFSENNIRTHPIFPWYLCGLAFNNIIKRTKHSTLYHQNDLHKMVESSPESL
jgi:hypothetical protein